MINYLSVSRRLMCVGALLAVFNSSAFGLGFGKLEVTSGLGEPFSGRINLTSLYAGDSENLGVALASLDDFNRAGLARPDILNNLQFEISYDAANKPYIKVHSDSPIDEPLLQFMVELKWQGGKLVRNFNVLLDPPAYVRKGGSAPAPEIDSNPEPAYADAVSQPAQPIEQPIEPVEPVIIERTSQEFIVVESAAAQVAGHGNVAEAEVVAGSDINEVSSFEVKRGQSLWIVADRTRGESTTVHQMMMAIFTENPRAFIKGDINKLKAGATLTIPSGALRNELSRSEAIAAFYRATQIESTDSIIAKTRADTQPAKEPETLIESEPALATGEAVSTTSTNQTEAPVSETIELTNAADQAMPAQTAVDESIESLATASGAADENTAASNPSGQAVQSSAKLTTYATDDNTLNLLTQEVALLETTLVQANTENQELKQRINELEDRVDFATRFLEFQNIALSITDDNTTNTGDNTAANTLTQTTIENESVAGDAATIDGKKGDSKSIIQEGLIAATEALSESADTLAQPEQTASETSPKLQPTGAEDNLATTQDATSPNSETGASGWTTFQDEVATRFDGLKSLFASSTSDTMQPILAIIAVVILALGALMAIFRHRSFSEVEYAAYPSNRGSTTRSMDRKPLRSYDNNISDSTKRKVQDKSSIPASTSPESSTDEAKTEKSSVKYAGASTLIEEAEVYMALGKEDKAEETLKNAIKGGSVDTEASIKLMEIYQKRQPKNPEPAPEVIPDPDIMEALAPSAPVLDPIQMESIKPPSPASDAMKKEGSPPSAPGPDPIQMEAIKTSSSASTPSETEEQIISSVARTDTKDDTAAGLSVPVPDPIQTESITPPTHEFEKIETETIRPVTPTPDPSQMETLRPRIEKPEKRSPLDQLSTAPATASSGEGIPMFDVEDDGLSPTERDALRKAAMTAEVDTKPDDVPVESEQKIGRRSKLLQASRGTEFETRSKDDQIKDLETKLDSLQNQMDEILRRLSRDDSSNSSGGAA
ncbi:MAG: hypothetical protein OER96_05370 [Gammaproteobacteria bacterium]|nr:hypothetical protein [Gammaproteobacteria bacterium]